MDGLLRPGPAAPMITGEITSLRPTFPASGQPTLAISGLNMLHRFAAKQERQAYENMTDSRDRPGDRRRLDVDRAHRPSRRRSARSSYDYLLQDNEYDIVFLLERARRIGYDLFVEEGDRAGNPPLVLRPVDRRRSAHLPADLRPVADRVPADPDHRQPGRRGHGAGLGRQEQAADQATRASASELTHQGLGRRPRRPGGSRTRSSHREEVITDRPVRHRAGGQDAGDARRWSASPRTWSRHRLDRRPARPAGRQRLRDRRAGRRGSPAATS